MKRTAAIILACIGWFAVITQFYLMMQNRVGSEAETIIRFFSFFTILTNLLVAIYFTTVSIKGVLLHPGRLTALTVYISIVGLVYQVVLRSLWHPVGMQKLVDELLHSVIPFLTLLFWFFCEVKSRLYYKRIPVWLVYPLVYLICILWRGSVSGFYPYPFIDLTLFTFKEVMLNSFYMLLAFYGVSALFIAIHNARVKTV